MTMTTTYVLGITDGMNWNAGGQTTIRAATLTEAKQAWREWAADGDYPVDGRVVVHGSVRSASGEILSSMSIEVDGSGS